VVYPHILSEEAKSSEWAVRGRVRADLPTDVPGMRAQFLAHEKEGGVAHAVSLWASLDAIREHEESSLFLNETWPILERFLGEGHKASNCEVRFRDGFD
jgi:hypothetical protein